MECIIDKKGKVAGWSSRCYRLRNCELIQYKRGIDSFKDCNDALIKKRYNLYDIRTIVLSAKQPYNLRIDIDTKYKEEPEILQLKFSNVNKKKKKMDHSFFCAWYRIFSAMSKPSKNLKCRDRPLPSNIGFALYYLLQKLYKHKELLNTANIFAEIENKNNHQKNKLFYNLVVNSRRYLSEMYEETDNFGDINVLSQTLLFTLSNMPTSLFGDSNCKSFTEETMKILASAKRAAYNEDKNYAAKIPLEENEDIDIKVIGKEKYLDRIRNMLYQRYKHKEKHKAAHGFHMLNRYAFMNILFLLLSTISNSRYYSVTRMNAKKLAKIFSKYLQSKRYLFNLRTEIIENFKKNEKTKKLKNRDEYYEKCFETMLKILIVYAKIIFPPLDSVNWNVSSLVHQQGEEREMVKAYNDTFSLDTVNKYFMPPILSKNRKYGTFDGEYYALRQERMDKESESEDSMSEHTKHIIKVTSPQMGAKKKSYVSERRGSYFEEPTYPSDMGMTTAEEPETEEESEMTPEDPLDSASVSMHERRVSLGTNNQIVLTQIVSVMDGIEEDKVAETEEKYDELSSPSSAFEPDVGGDKYEEKKMADTLKVLDPTKYGGVSKSDIDYDSSALPEEDLLDVNAISPAVTYVEPKVGYTESSPSEDTPQVTAQEQDKKVVDELDKNAELIQNAMTESKQVMKDKERERRIQQVLDNYNVHERADMQFDNELMEYEQKNHSDENPLSWLAQCELCLYAPLKSLFQKNNVNTNYGFTQPLQQPPQQYYYNHGASNYQTNQYAQYQQPQIQQEQQQQQQQQPANIIESNMPPTIVKKKSSQKSLNNIKTNDQRSKRYLLSNSRKQRSFHRPTATEEAPGIVSDEEEDMKYETSNRFGPGYDNLDDWKLEGGKLKINLLGATNMEDLDFGINHMGLDINDVSDVFCTFQVSNSKPQKSTIKKDSRNPKWDGEEFIFDVKDPMNDILIINVEDYDATINDNIGRVQIKIKDIINSSGIIKKRGFKVVGSKEGKLYLDLHYYEEWYNIADYNRKRYRTIGQG